MILKIHRAHVEIEDKTQEIITLLDNGIGSDLVANDGEYSSHVTNFRNYKELKMRKRLAVKFLVKGDAKTSYYVNKMAQIRIGDGLLPYSPECCGSDAKVLKLPEEPTGIFQRHCDAGSIWVKNPPSDDIFPPSPVRDLKVYKGERGIEATFTSPGGDFDRGIATLYRFFYSYPAKNDTNPRTFEVKNDELLDGSLKSPLPAGEKVVLVLPKDYFDQNHTEVTLYVTVTDDEGNQSNQKSNIAWFYNEY